MSIALRFQQSLQDALARWSMTLTPEQLDRLTRHYGEMVRTNQELNLTRITDPTEAAVKLYADSLALLLWARSSGATVGRLADIGTGAGFPAFPLAVAQPMWSVSALEGRYKKVEFLKRVIESAQVTNLKVHHRRAEDWRDRAERFDVVTVKAVGSLALCLNLGQKLIKPGGYLVAYKTTTVPPLEEREAAKHVTRLGYESETQVPYELICDSERMVRVLRIYRLLREARDPLSFTVP